MIQTAYEILSDVSFQLGEPTVDTGVSRITLFNKAYQYYLGIHRWSFKIKDYNLTTTNIKEYDLTALIDDYSQIDGVYEVRSSGGELIEPISYEDKDIIGEGGKPKYYLTPDKKKIGFVSVTPSSVFQIKYYAVLKKINNANDTLNIPIPEFHKEPITSYLLSLIYKRKRQRYDQRNALLEFKEQLEEAQVKDAQKGEISFVPRIYTPVKKILGFNR